MKVNKLIELKEISEKEFIIKLKSFFLAKNQNYD